MIGYVVILELNFLVYQSELSSHMQPELHWL